MALTSSGLAAKKQTTLHQKGINVDTVGDARGTSTVTTIIDASGGKMPATLASLKSSFTGTVVTTSNPYATAYPSANMIVVLGNDQIPSTASSSTTMSH